MKYIALKLKGKIMDMQPMDEMVSDEVRKMRTKTLELMVDLLNPSVTGDLAQDCMAIMQDELNRRKDTSVGDRVGGQIDKGIEAANAVLDRVLNWKSKRK